MCIDGKSVAIALLAAIVSLPAHTFDSCFIESPVRGLRVTDLTLNGFGVKWDTNVIPHEHPTGIRVALDGRDATPNIPWWMMIFEKGAGFNAAEDGLQPGGTYVVYVEQRSICGEWTGEELSVTLPSSTVAMTVEQMAGYTEAVEADVAPTVEAYNTTYGGCGDEYGACAPTDLENLESLGTTAGEERGVYSGGVQHDESLLTLEDDSVIQSVFEHEGQFFITTVEGVPVDVLTPGVEFEYDRESGMTLIHGSLYGLHLRIGDIEYLVDDTGNLIEAT